MNLTKNVYLRTMISHCNAKTHFSVQSHLQILNIQIELKLAQNFYKIYNVFAFSILAPNVQTSPTHGLNT
jgi:hypothetical protein